MSIILHMLNKKKLFQKNVLNRLKFEIVLFYRHPRFSRTEFSNKLIASDLMMLYIIQR